MYDAIELWHLRGRPQQPRGKGNAGFAATALQARWALGSGGVKQGSRQVEASLQELPCGLLSMRLAPHSGAASGARRGAPPASQRRPIPRAPAGPDHSGVISTTNQRTPIDPQRPAQSDERDGER